MPKTQRDSLFQLIKTLSKAEKRHLKLYINRNPTSANSLYLKLFDYLDRQTHYDEDAIIDRVDGIKKNQLSNLKSNLYKQILVSLRLLHRAQNTEISVREQLDFAQVLYMKGLYRQSLTLLERAKQRAMSLYLHPLAMEIAAFERLVESQHITGSIDTRAEDLSAQTTQLSNLVASESQFANLSLQLYGLYLRMGYARNDRELTYAREFFKAKLPDFQEDRLSFFEKLFLYQSYVWLYTITHEFPKQYRYAQKWVDLFHEHSELLAHNIPLYLKGLHNLLIAQYVTLQYSKFVVTLNELIQFNSDGRFTLTGNERSLYYLFTYIHRLNRHYLEGSFSEGLAWIEELIDVLDNDTYQWDDHRVMVFYYKIACLYFAGGHNSTAIEYLNKIINQPNPDFREDIQSFARILNLIAHFELGNDTLVSYQLKSVYRFLLKKEELNATHHEIIKFLRRTPQIPRNQVRAAFNQLQQRLEQVQTQEYERRSLLYLDITSWLESKITDVPVQDVIRNKFLKQYATLPEAKSDSNPS